MNGQKPAMLVPTRSSQSGAVDVLCDTCRDLLIRPDEDPDTDVENTYRSHEILKATKRGCPICMRLHPMLLSNTGSATVTTKTSFVAILMTLLGSMACDDVVPIAKERGLRFDNHAASVFYYLRPSARIDGQLMMHTERFHPSHPYLVPVAESIAPYSGNDSRLTTIKAWLDTCDQEHTYCKALSARDSITTLPTRVIHVPVAQRPTLILVDQIQGKSSLRYATLSHRWRNEANMPKLMRNNLNALRQGTVIETLPKVFTDSMEMCRRLNIQYLWIDALCIIQDDAADCEKEIANMGEIYANADINFGATGAVDDHERGLFYESEVEAMLPFHLPVHRKGLQVDYLAYNAKANFGISTSTLLSRGWVLQERMLSRRSIYFGDMLSWECCTIIANEIFPGGIPFTRGFQPSWGRHKPLRLPRLLDFDNKGREVDKHDELYKRWFFISIEYSRCTLTYKVDALSAISGLARAFSRALQDTYLVGVWRKNLIPSLLWYVRQFIIQREKTEANVPPHEYIAPSWSWLSVTTPIDFIAVNHSTWNSTTSSKVVAEYIETHVEYAGNDIMGRVSGGYLRLFCHIRPGHDRSTHHGPLGQVMTYERFDTGYAGNGKRDVLGTWYCVLAYSEPSYVEVMNSKDKNESLQLEHGHIIGLILEIAKESPKTYHRIGMFTHAWGEGTPDLVAEQYPEFTNVNDPASLEREVIVIT